MLIILIIKVIDDIIKNAQHAEPWAVGTSGIPSSLFCCLYKFMTMRLNCKFLQNS